MTKHKQVTYFMHEHKFHSQPIGSLLTGRKYTVWTLFTTAGISWIWAFSTGLVGGTSSMKLSIETDHLLGNYIELSRTEQSQKCVHLLDSIGQYFGYTRSNIGRGLYLRNAVQPVVSFRTFLCLDSHRCLPLSTYPYITLCTSSRLKSIRSGQFSLAFMLGKTNKAASIKVERQADW